MLVACDWPVYPRLRRTMRASTSARNPTSKADLNVDALPENVAVPEAGRRLRCSQCGGKQINTRPAWHTAVFGPRSGDREAPESLALSILVEFFGCQIICFRA